MCGQTLVCIEHHEPIEFNEDELRRLRRTHFVHCEKCFLVKKRFFKRFFKNLFKNLDEQSLLSWDRHVRFAVESISKEFPELKYGECINHSAKLFPKGRTLVDRVKHKAERGDEK